MSHSLSPDPTQRFSSRVENYVKYRPSYPVAIIGLLQQDCGLTQTGVIADIGSGTGLLTQLFLQSGNTVFAVEPNDAMRAAGEQFLQPYASQLRSIATTAEATTLADDSIDFIVAGQAFHWFDRPRARQEFERILKPGGWVVLIWNDRETNSTPFLVGYEQLLQQFGTDYNQINHRHIDEAVLVEFYGRNALKTRTFHNHQNFDHEGLQGRLLSSSYTPGPNHPNYKPMLEATKVLFETHAIADTVRFEYITRVYYGKI